MFNQMDNLMTKLKEEEYFEFDDGKSLSNIDFQSFNKEGDWDKVKRARRSKNDQVGRNHICKKCGKCYLSYPALYTHIKTKHSLKEVSANCRGRGRPKKDNMEEGVIKIN